MPSGQIVQDRTLMHDYRHVNGSNQIHSDIFKSVKEQEAHFEQLTRELEEERQNVAQQLEKCKIAKENFASPANSSPNWSDKNSTSFNGVEDGKMSNSQLVDSCIDQEHIIEGPTDVQESRYNISYPTTTAPNGHHNMSFKDNDSLTRNNNPSPNPSQMSVQSDPQLISRSSTQTRTQQVTTVTKVIREVKHLGPDGQPIEYPPASSQSPYTTSVNSDYGMSPHNTGYGNYSPAPPLQQPHDYSTYNSSHGAPSPAVGSTRSYQDYDYHPDYPPTSRHDVPEDPYSRGRRPPTSDYSQASPYPQYTSSKQPWDSNRPLTPPSPTSTLSTSPPPQRAMPQAPAGADPSDYSHSSGYPPDQPTSGYRDLDSSSLQRTLPRDRDPQLPISDVYGSRQSPSPPPGSDRYGTYGHHSGAPLLQSPYSPYEATDRPIGYLDMKPSYADPQTPTGTLGHGSQYNGPTQGQYVDDDGRMEYDRKQRHMPQIDVSEMPRDVRWRDPDLSEVIEFLQNSNNVVRANAAAYLQHLCYMDNDMKQKTRSLGGIPPLVDQLNHDIPEVHRNACGALRNLSYGRSNDENKRAIRNAGGIPALVRLLRKTPDNEVRELITGILWNLSSCEDLKKPIIDDGLTVITNNVIIPHSGWDRDNRPDVNKHHDIYWSTVFRNASGILRNVSSAGEYARKKLRECDGLVDAVLHLVNAAIGKSDIDNKSVENCVCVLRNLSYRCQEVEDPDYDKNLMPQPQNRASMPSKVGDNLGCFGASKKKKNEPNQANDRQSRKDTSMNASTSSGATSRTRSDPAKGMELLWQPEIVQTYLALLSECSNPDTLEASAGALQNLSACYWQASIDIRASVRKEKGLPILVELLRMENDRVVCAVATALRNLAIDQRNKELIGKYAIRDLLQKLPNGHPQHDTGTSDDTIAAVLATMNEVVRKNSVFARTMVDASGVDRLLYIQKNIQRFSPRVIKFTQQLLQNLWQHQELHEVYRKMGWKEANFIARRPVVVRSQSPHNNTLSRPMSTQGGTKYEDRTLQRGRDLNTSTHNAHSIDPRSVGHPEEMPMSNIGHPPSYHEATDRINTLSANSHTPHRVPVGGVPIFPPGAQQQQQMGLPGEPVYAQVNRDRKKNRQYEISSQSTLLDNQAPPGGGDSWV